MKNHEIMTDFSDKFREIIIRYKRISSNLRVMRQFVYIINQITVDCFAVRFNCTQVVLPSEYDGPKHKAIHCSLLEHELFRLLVSPFEFNCLFV